MLFAAWRSEGTRESDPVWETLRRWVEVHSRDAAVTSTCLVGVSASDRLMPFQGGWRVWSYRGAPVDDPSGGSGPDVTAKTTGLVATAGAFPQQPLYYLRWRKSSAVAVCTRLEPLARALPDRRLRLSKLVTMMLWANDEDPSATPFEGLQRIRPCESLSVGPSGHEMTRAIPTLGDVYVNGSAEAVSRELRGIIEDALERATVGAGRVGIHVGGGLDSSGLLALSLMASRRKGGPPVEALTLDFASPGDDRPHMQELSRSLGIEPVRLDPAGASTYFSKGFCVDAQPGFVSSCCFDPQLARAAAERGLDVVLHGTQGDAMLGPMHGPALLARKGRLLRASIAAARFRVPWESSGASRVRDLALLPAVRARLPLSLRRAARRVRSARVHWFSRDAREMFLRACDARGPAPIPASPDELVKARCEGISAADYADSLGQVAALTGYAPFDVYYDPALVRFLSRVDPMLLNHGHDFRGLYRLAMKGVLPETVRTRTDKARLEPAVARAALAGDGLAVMRDLSSLSSLSSLGLVDMDRFRPQAEACLASVSRGLRTFDEGFDNWEPFWRTLAIECFVRTWGSARPPEEASC